jgi:C1A family cysteine protease
MWSFSPKINYIKYGWKPDLPDHRDFEYALHFTAPAVIPQTVDLRKQCSKVEDQGQLGSCTANALVGNLELLEIKSATSFIDLSRLFVYYNERELDYTTSQDSGSYLRTGIKTLAAKGICTEKSWPYDIKKFTNKPLPKCYQEALSHKITKYVRINTLNEMLQCLADGYPFVFGFTVYDYFESADMANTGILHIPTKYEQVLGGHAVMACGYDQSKKMILARNSWGTLWGLEGYFWMPFDYVSNRSLSDDFWTIRK